MAEKIQFISTLSNKVIVLNLGWESAIKYAEERYRELNDRLFYYLDPPFYVKAKDLYRVSFTNDEHILLSTYLRNFKRNWILSYDKVPEIINLYSAKNYNPIHINIPYSLNSKSNRIEKELIITPLELPS